MMIDLRPDRTSVIVLAVLAAVLALTFAVYLPGLAGPLTLDDIPQLNSLIAQSGEDPSMLFGNYVISRSGQLGRPVSMVTFILDAIAHGPDTWWWKYDNLLLHLVNGLLVLWLTALLARASRLGDSLSPWLAGLVVCGFWLLHPLQVSTVLYTVQRMTELSTLFVLAGLIAYAKGRLAHETSGVRGWSYIAIGFAVFFPLSVFSKENGLLYPVYCTLFELLVFRFRGPGGVRKPVKALHAVLGAGYLCAAVFVIANFSSFVLDSYSNRDITFSERVLSQFRVVVTYLFQLIAPAQRRMGFFHDDFEVSRGFFDPVTTILSAILLAALAASAVVLRKKSPLYALGILFYFASHALESTIFDLEIMFEHRNYLGSFGIVLAVVAAASQAVANRKALGYAAVAIVCGFAFLTWQRSTTWSSPTTMYAYMYRVHPQSLRLNALYADIYTLAGEFDNARQSVDRLEPGPDPALHRLWIDCREYHKVEGDALEAVTGMRRTVVAAYTTSTVSSLVRETLSEGCDVPRDGFVRVIDFLLESTARSPIDRRALLFAKAKLLDSMSEVDAAVDAYLQAQELSDAIALPLYLAADTLARNRRPDEARAMLERAIERERTTRIKRRDLAQKIFSGLGEYYAVHGRPEDALDLYREAIQAMPDRSSSYVAAAELLMRMRRHAEAREMLAAMDSRGTVDADRFEYAVARLRDQLAEGT